MTEEKRPSEDRRITWPVYPTPIEDMATLDALRAIAEELRAFRLTLPEMAINMSTGGITIGGLGGDQEEEALNEEPSKPWDEQGPMRTDRFLDQLADNLTRNDFPHTIVRLRAMAQAYREQKVHKEEG